MLARERLGLSEVAPVYGIDWSRPTLAEVQQQIRALDVRIGYMDDGSTPQSVS